MKQKILYLLLFLYSITYAQIPTNGLQAMYEFTNGSLVDAANSNNFTQTGTALTQVNDRLNNTTSAINLNGDYLSRANISTGAEITYSFWVKTNTDTFDYKTIIDDSEKNGGSNNFAGTQKGYSIMLYRGRIIADVRMQHRARFTNAQAYTTTTATSAFIADGNWHHVVVRFKGYKGSGTNYYGLASVHIDGTLHEEIDLFYGNAGSVPVFDTNGNVTVANNKNNTINSNLKYNGAIDDILVYNRELTSQEILNIRDVGGYCIPPNNSTFNSTTITETSISLATPATAHDIAYHKSSEPFANATILSGVINSTTINGLNASTPYTFYIRTPCATTGSSQWSVAKIIRTSGTIYVNHAATGNNDGSSWANAYTDLRGSIFLSGTDKPIWVASGTYKPHATTRFVYFYINKENIKIYGGFAGTETSISQRIVGANETILSGDLQGNDTNLTGFASNYANSTRNADNSYHVISIGSSGNNLLLDGLTISDAHTNMNPSEKGGAIIKDKTVAKLTLKNCIIKDNVSRNDNAGLLAEFELNNTSGIRGELIIENCKFINNMSRWASGIYSFIRDNTNVDITVINSLFDNNFSGDLSSNDKGISGSASWFRMLGNGANATLNLTNNTYVNNVDTGTTNVNNLTRAVSGISIPSGFNGVFNAQVNNCIFWGNTTTGGATTRSITDLYSTPITSLVVNNSIDELNFNDDSITSTTNTSNSDPLFTSTTDFTLQSGSPAKDTGDNTKVISNTDLLGNNRIFNTTVDMGAYEFGSTPYVERTLTINATNGTVATNPNPNGNGAYADGTSVELTATPDSGYQFDGWSGDASGTTNPLNITMDADKTITAIFSLIPAPIPTFVNSPTNISGAYTATINFSSAVTGFDMSDITVTGASLSNFTAVSGTEYTVLVTPTSICNTTVTLQVPANVAQDSNNVNNTVSSVVTINAVDNVNPTVITQDFTLQLDANGQGIITIFNIDNGSTDNCTIDTRNLNITNFTCANLGANTVTLTVEDSSGNTNTATATVTVIDNVAPTVITQDITVQLGANGQVSITPSDINNGSSDNCAIAGISINNPNFTCNNLGANNVTLTVQDTSGNTNTATAVVTVTQNPNAQLAAVTQNITVQLDANGNATITPSQVDNGSGSGCNSTPNLSLDKTTFTCANLGTNTVTLTATDAGNSDSATATVTVEDKIAPTVVAQNFTLQLDANGQGTLSVANIDNGSSDNCNIESIILDKTSFDCSNIGANVVKLTVTDASGNSSDATVTVTVEDQINPTIVPKNITVQLGTNGVANIIASDVYNSTSDNCSVTSVSIDKNNFTCNDLGANNVVLTVEDASGNTNTATAVVTVNQNPNAQLAAVTQNITVQLDANGAATITPSQVDNGSGSGCNSTPTLSLDKTTFTCADLGANTVTLTATDSGNSVTNTATVTVEDKIAPTVIAQNFTLQLDANGQGTLSVANIDNGSSDNCNIESIILDKTSFNCSNIGANTVKLTVTDASGKSSDATVTVTVEDNISPTIVPKNITVQLGTNGVANIIASDVYNSTSDNCSVNSVSADILNFTCNNLGANTVTLTARDVSGNTTTATATVTVNQNPNAQLAAVTQNITVQLDANGNATITPQQVDNGSGSGCNSNPTLSLDKTTFTCADLGANTVTLTATDAGNSDSAIATVTIEDKIAPTVVAQNFTLQLDANGQGTLSVANIDNGSSDNCNIESIILDKTNFDCSNIGANVVKLTVTDASGNSSDATVTVTVEDKIAPTAIAQDIAVQLGAGGQVSIAAADINNGSSDNCTTATNLTYSLDTTSFSCSEVGTNNVVLIVTDASGNSATASAVVTVSEDPNLPLTTVTQDITVQLDADGSVTITPSQVDNGSGSGCNSNPTLTLDVATFDCSNIGANTVTLTANDGTTSVTATAIVTVEDKASPTATTQDITVTLDANGQGSITIAEIDNGSTDNCGINTRTLDVTSFTCADLGANTVTLTIVDNYGNTANATATVTVVETVAPTVLTQNITVAIDADGNLNITPQQIDNGSTDACSGIATMSLDQNSFSCPTLGDVTVTLTVTDVSGNSATKTAIVTITGPDEDNDGISDACDSKEIILSKGFSPNGDGQNDTWVVENIDNYPNNKVEIFNRWGERIYQANNYQNDWDAKSNQRGGSNEKLPVGSYYYIINLNEPGINPIQGWLYINY